MDDDYTVTFDGVFFTKPASGGGHRTYRVLCVSDNRPATVVIHHAAGVSPLCADCLRAGLVPDTRTQRLVRERDR